MAERYRDAALQADRALGMLMRLDVAGVLPPSARLRRPRRSKHGPDHPKLRLKRNRNVQLAREDWCRSGPEGSVGVRWLPPGAVLALNGDIGGSDGQYPVALKPPDIQPAARRWLPGAGTTIRCRRNSPMRRIQCRTGWASRNCIEHHRGGRDRNRSAPTCHQQPGRHHRRMAG